MRVACPECSAAYELPPALAARLGEGRPLRCARCGHTWAPGPAEAAPAAAPPPPAPDLEPSPPDGPAWPTLLASIPQPAPAAPVPPAAPPGRGAALLARLPRLPADRAGATLAAAWAASVLLLAGGALAAWHWRVAIVEAWPPAARAFLALGLAG